MQAGESLSFISTPEELAVVDARGEVEQEAIWEAFGTLAQGLLAQYPDAFRSIEQTEESGLITVFEGSFSLPFSDGSYLYVVVYGHSDDVGYLDLGLSIVEHSQEGANLGGYLYEMSGERVRFAQHKGLLRNAVSGGDDSTEGPDTVDYEHFSLVGYYEYANEAYSLQFSEDDGVRELAEEAIRQLELEASLGQTERELGFGWGSPTLEDIEKLQGLTSLVSPFKVESR